MTPGNIAAWLGIISTLAVGVARVTSLESARETQVALTAQLSEVTKRHAERISELEKSHDMLERVHQLELRLERLETEEARPPRGRHAR